MNSGTWQIHKDPLVPLSFVLTFFFFMKTKDIYLFKNKVKIPKEEKFLLCRATLVSSDTIKFISFDNTWKLNYMYKC